MLISYYANKKSSPRLPSWQPSLIFFNIPIESGTTIKPCTLKHFQVTYMLHKAGYWTNQQLPFESKGICVKINHVMKSCCLPKVLSTNVWNLVDILSLFSVRETNDHPLVNASAFWAGWVENWPGQVEFCIKHIRGICFRAYVPYI